MRSIGDRSGPAALIAIGLGIVLASCARDPVSEIAAPAADQLSPQAPAVHSQEPTLVFFVSELGKFQAWVPISGNVEQYVTTRTRLGQSVECSVTGSRLNGAYSVVEYCDLASERIAALSVDEILDQVREEIADDFAVRVDAEHRSLIDGAYPALTLSGQENMRGVGYDGTYRARIILVANRIYLVAMSVHAENWCNCLHQLDQVVDSFHVDPDLSIPFELNR